MRSSLRLLNLEATPLQGSRTRYVCSVCRQEARPRPFVARQFLRNASDSSTPITERVRRKIWGTDNPPGLKDPYGGEGVFEKKFKRSQAAREEDQGVEATPAETQNAAVETAAEEAVPEGSSAYEPATTWEGLERIGHLGKWSDYPPSEADAYNSFFSNRRVTKPGQLALAAHQAAVELCLMHSLDKPLARVCDVVEHEKAVFELMLNCKIQPNGQWNSALEYPDKETEEALVYIFQQIGGQNESTQPEEAAEEDVENAETEEIEEVEAAGPPKKFAFFGYRDVKDKGYLSLSLADPAIKFAFLKRFSQLTGHYFPDPTIESINTVQHVMSHVNKETAPKPKKLIDHLEANEELQSLPNVKIFGKKQKPWHQDEELGRKKIIDAELRARGLIE